MTSEEEGDIINKLSLREVILERSRKKLLKKFKKSIDKTVKRWYNKYPLPHFLGEAKWTLRIKQCRLLKSFDII